MNQKLIDLSVWLRSHPVPNLNMKTWYSVDDSGTASYCIIGWVAKNKMFGFYLNGMNQPRHNISTSTGSWSAILLGLSVRSQTALQLFYPAYTKGLTFDQLVNRIEAAGKSEEHVLLQIIL